jgi:hypothetical protein
MSYVFTIYASSKTVKEYKTLYLTHEANELIQQTIIFPLGINDGME